MTESISILLGSGFSAPMGYPTGVSLNNLLVNCTGNNFAFSSGGKLCVSTDGEKPSFGYKNDYDRRFDFCKELIKYFKKSKGYFDYEEFYDFMIGEAKGDLKVKKLAQPYIYKHRPFDQLIFSLPNIYAQLISHYIKDRDGIVYYDNAGHIGGLIFPGYTGILNCLRKLSEKYIIHVHTLNHDLFFERLNHSDWLNGELCDGFEELGSPYYGKLEVNKRIYRARLERYTGKYLKKIRLYKLHGSLDYAIFYELGDSSFATPEMYLKTRYGIDISELYKEKANDNGTLEYDHCFVNFHADFLTGTTSKIERYKEPLLYKHLFELFRQNLKDATMLLIVGYGGRDTEINKMLLANFDCKHKPSYIIDPYAGNKVKQITSELNSTLISKSLETIISEDIGIS